jgi:hypothetical protein
MQSTFIKMKSHILFTKWDLERMAQREHKPVWKWIFPNWFKKPPKEVWEEAFPWP